MVERRRWLGCRFLLSGIFGIFHLDGRPADPADLARMGAALAHRGPDGSGAWCGGAVGLGHRMPHATPESLHETLPLRHRAGHLVLTADARIDNRDELIPMLAIQRPPAEITDSDLILAAYEKWGARCPEKLLGDFAFAIWDTRAQALFCARDPFGVRPFYYYHDTERLFAFGSEIKALLTLQEIPRRLDEVRMATCLGLAPPDQTITAYERIVRLPPACEMTVRGRGATPPRRYWAPDVSQEMSLPSDAAYAEAFLEVFGEAVRCRLRGAHPVGALLSGGLDSSSVACLARKGRMDNAPLPTFSALFSDPAADERLFMDTVVAQGGIVPHFLDADRRSPLADLDRVIGHDDNLTLPYSVGVLWGLYEMAQRQRVRVLLTGLDGDMTVSHGDGVPVEMAYAGRGIALARALRTLSKNLGYSPWALFWGLVLRPRIPTPMVAAWRRFRQSALGAATGLPVAVTGLPVGRSLAHPDFVQRMRTQDRFCALSHLTPKPFRTERERHCMTMIANSILTLELEEADVQSAAFSIDIRHPFYDRRLVAFCLALPWEQKIGGGWTRWIFRRAMSGLLPEAIQWRLGKGNWVPSFCQGLIGHERQRLDALMFGDSTSLDAAAPYVNLAVLRQTYQRYAQRPTQADAFAVWKGVVLALWLQKKGL